MGGKYITEGAVMGTDSVTSPAVAAAVWGLTPCRARQRWLTMFNKAVDKGAAQSENRQEVCYHIQHRFTTRGIFFK